MAMGEQNFLKIPFILAVGLACHISLTPPAQPKADERVPVKGAEHWIEAGLNAVNILKGTYWILSLIEVASILRGSYDLFYMTPISMTGFVLIVLGALLRRSCYQTMGPQFTLQLSVRKADKLVSSGPYAYVRHPAYTGMFMIYTGLILWHGSAGSWIKESGVLEITAGFIYVTAFTFYITVVEFALMMRIPKEEKQLKELYGKEWDEFTQKVPYILIPAVL